jgi:predicted nuclease of predicted toxin-antitoxin system
MKLLIDMNLTPRWVEHLTASGWEALHWSVAGSAQATDREICQWAREHAFIVVTNDLDFPQILAHARSNGPSAILLRGEPLVPEVRGEGLARVLRQCEGELTAGAIATLDWDDGFRVRLLPLA